MATIGFIGGTGPEGLGLAMRLALADDRVLIGSRRPERAEAAAQQVRDALAAVGRTADAGGGVNREVVREADVIIVVVPFDGHEATLIDLRDDIGSKIVVDAAVPLEFVNGQPGVVAVEQGSATEQAQALLPAARVVGAFHNLSARKLQALDDEMGRRCADHGRRRRGQADRDRDGRADAAVAAGRRGGAGDVELR